MSYKPFAVSEVIVPCDLYDGDIWYPMNGRVVRINESITLEDNILWNRFSNTNTYFTTIYENLRYETGSTIYCDHIHGKTAGGGKTYGQNSIWIQGTYEYKRLYINIGAETITEFKQITNGFHIIAPLSEPIIEHYSPQPIFAPAGTVNVLQSPTDLPARLSATMMVRR